jgi:hypothetical protein
VIASVRVCGIINIDHPFDDDWIIREMLESGSLRCYEL